MAATEGEREEEKGFKQFVEEQPSSMHEQGFLAVLDRFCKLEQSVEEAVRKERLAREAGEAELRDLVVEERKVRELQLVRETGPGGDLGHERAAKLEALLQQERDSRKADVQELRQLLSNTKPAEGGFSPVDDLQALLAREKEARDLHLGSVQDLLSLESGARQAHAQDVQAQLAAHREEYEVLVDKLEEMLAGEREVRVQVEDKLQEQLSAIEQKLLEEIEGLRKAAGGVQPPAGDHWSSVREALAQERQAREVDHKSMQDHLASERTAREQQQAAMAERLGRAEGELHEAMGRHSAQLERHSGKLERHAEAVQAQLDSLGEGVSQQLSRHQDDVLAHRRDIEAHLAEQLEAAQALLDAQRGDLLAHGARHDELLDRLAVLESSREPDSSRQGHPDTQSIELLHDGERQEAIQLLHDDVRHLASGHFSQEAHEDFRDRLDSHANVMEVKHRDLERCVAKEQDAREMHEHRVGEAIRSEKGLREQQLESLAKVIEQEREQREHHIAALHDVMRQERTHREALHDSHQQALEHERAMRERAHGELRELLAGERSSVPLPQAADEASVAARMTSLERTVAVFGNIVRNEQDDRAKEFKRIWEVLDSGRAFGHASGASSPHLTHAAAHHRASTSHPQAAGTSHSQASTRAASPPRHQNVAVRRASSPVCTSAPTASRFVGEVHVHTENPAHVLSPRQVKPCRSAAQVRTRTESPARAVSPAPVAAGLASPRAMRRATVQGDPAFSPMAQLGRDTAGSSDGWASLARRSSSALLAATTKALGSQRPSLPVSPPLDSHMNGGGTFPNGMSLPASAPLDGRMLQGAVDALNPGVRASMVHSPPSSFKPRNTSASLGSTILPGPPVVLPGNSRLSQVAAPVRSYGSTIGLLGQDPDELSI